MPHTNLKGAYKAAQRFCKAMPQETLQVEDKTVSINVSIGIATYDQKDQKIDDILRRADLSLFVAKKNGRNRVAIMHEEQLKVSQ